MKSSSRIVQVTVFLGCNHAGLRVMLLLLAIIFASIYTAIAGKIPKSILEALMTATF